MQSASACLNILACPSHIYLADQELEYIATCIIKEQQADLRCIYTGEEARSAALQVTTARLASINSLLREVAIIQRHAEQLCPGQHPVSDVMSEFSLDEPESSSHAAHAELGLNHVESSLGASAVADASGKSEEVPEAANALSESTTEKSGNAMSTGSGLVEPAVCCESLQGNDGLPQGCAASTSADALACYKPLAPATLGSDRPAEGIEQSPLPGIMRGLQQAMTDSISSSGRRSPAMTALWFVA